LTGDGIGTTATTVRLGASLQRMMPTIAMMHRVTSDQGTALCGVGLAALLRLLAFRIKILRPTTADRLRNRTVIANYRAIEKFENLIVGLPDAAALNLSILFSVDT
jgi:hypothetical protein